jgi:hypothetical protein
LVSIRVLWLGFTDGRCLWLLSLLAAAKRIGSDSPGLDDGDIVPDPDHKGPAIELTPPQQA